MNAREVREMKAKIVQLTSALKDVQNLSLAGFNSGDLGDQERTGVYAAISQCAQDMGTFCLNSLAHFSAATEAVGSGLSPSDISVIADAIPGMDEVELWTCGEFLDVSNALDCAKWHFPSTSLGNPNSLYHRGAVVCNIEEAIHRLETNLIPLLDIAYPPDLLVTALRAFLAKRLGNAA